MGHACKEMEQRVINRDRAFHWHRCDAAWSFPQRPQVARRSRARGGREHSVSCLYSSYSSAVNSDRTPIRYILQNHLLFQLAEQPPADMAALMSAFRTSMSPVVKRQLKALLTTIRDAVQRGMKFVTAAAPTPEEKPKNVAALDVEMKELEIEELKPETPKSGGQATAVDIWASSRMLPFVSTSSYLTRL